MSSYGGEKPALIPPLAPPVMIEIAGHFRYAGCGIVFSFRRASQLSTSVDAAKPVALYTLAYGVCNHRVEGRLIPPLQQASGFDRRRVDVRSTKMGVYSHEIRCSQSVMV